MRGSYIYGWVAIALCAVFTTGCGESPDSSETPARPTATDGETVEFAGVPLPPGATRVNYGEDEGSGPPYVAADYDGVSEEELLQHFKEYFEADGWAPLMAEDQMPPKMLNYRKGSKSLMVTANSLLGSVHLMVMSPESGAKRAEATPEEIARAATKIPLPPNAGNIQIDRAETGESFSVSAYLAEGDMDEVTSFYEEHFEELGWPAVEPSDGDYGRMLNAEHGKESVYISLKDLGSGLSLEIDYVLRDHSREEFAALVETTASAEALEVVRKVEAAYRALTSYADTGEHETLHEGMALSSDTFSTRFTAPGELLLEHTSVLTGVFTTKIVLSKRGDKVEIRSNIAALSESESDLPLAIGSLYGVTSGISGNIPNLLIESEESLLFRLAELKLLQEEAADDGTLCYRLHGKNLVGGESTIWVGKDDFMIRKIVSNMNWKYRQTTTYRPQPDAEITQEMLEPPDLG